MDGKVKTPSPLLNREDSPDSPETTHSSPVSFSKEYSNSPTSPATNVSERTKKKRPRNTSTEQAVDPPLKKFRSLLSESVDEDSAKRNLIDTPPSSSPPPFSSPPPPTSPLPSLSCPVVSRATLPSSSPASPASPHDIRQRLRLLQTALVTGVLTAPTDPSNTYDFNQTTTAFRNRVLLLLRMAAVSYSSAISASDIELLDRALSDVCMIQNGTSTAIIDTNSMNQLCQIIAQVARIQVVSGVASLPSSRASQAEVYAFNDLCGLCVRGSVLESMSQSSQALGLLYHRATHLLLYVFLDAISEQPLLRSNRKRKKALAAFQNAAFKLRSVMRNQIHASKECD